VANTSLLGKFRKGTNYLVTFPTVPSFTTQPTTVELFQKQYKHDVLLLEFPFVSEELTNQLKTGVPIQFTWTQGTRSKTWYGYIASVTKQNAAQQSRKMRVQAVGASFVLKKRSTKVFTDVTIPEVAEKVAKEHKLKFVGENHPERFNQVTFAGQSQWEWLQEMAKRIGYVFLVDETSLIFSPIDTFLDDSSSDAPIFQLWNERIPTSNTHLDRTLDDFTVLSGENIEDQTASRATKYVGGVDPITGRVIDANKTPSDTGSALRLEISSTLFDEYKSDVVVTRSRDAKLAAEAAAHLARFNLPAVAKGQGDPRVRPFTLVYVEGIAEQSDGYWVVRDVVHRFKLDGDYYVDMNVATDGIKQNRKTTTRRADKAVASQVNLIRAARKLSRASFTGGIDLSKELFVSRASSESTPSSKLTAPKVMGGGIAGRKSSTIPLPSGIGAEGVPIPAAQGFVRTPVIWQSTALDSSNSLRRRKCCNCK
jgi:phage protein D